MEAALQAAPAISTYPDNTSFNSEHTDLQFGPLKGAAHEVIIMEESPPPPLPEEVLPCRPSPAPPPATHIDNTHEVEEFEDLVRVEELVRDRDDLEGGDDEIPFSADYVDDEPSSALALRVSRAMDNPSPPPSPLPPLDELEPTFFGSSLQDSEILGDTAITPIPNEDSVLSEPSASWSNKLESPVNLSAQPDDLINFDSTLDIPVQLSPREQSAASDSPVSEVDALFLNSPSIEDASPPDTSEVILTKGESEPEGIVASSGLTPPPSTPPPARALRRSPRKSVVPTMTPAGTPLASSTLRGSSRSPRKKKKIIEEIVEDSQDEGDFPFNISLLPVQSTSLTTIPRTKERSRSRSPLVFSREVGSLSPTTSNLLTQLVTSFTDSTPLQLDTEPGEQVRSSQGMQSFSVFSAPLDAQPSTPQRPSSPIRLTTMGSELQRQISEQDPAATPARRITFEAAIASGQISPLKAAQMGFTPKASLSSVPQTPARRILISEKPSQAHPSGKNASRFATPVRGRSQEPPSRAWAGSSMNRSNHVAFQRPTATTPSMSMNNVTSTSHGGRSNPLPFPIIAAAKPPPSFVPNGKDTAKAPLSSPVKSCLKQVASRIPRIGAKPYTRALATAKTPVQRLQKPALSPAPRPTIVRKVELSKPSTNKTVANRSLSSSIILAPTKGKETRPVRSILPASSPSTSAASSTIKRKRSPDKIPSPLKSRMPSSRQPPATASTSRTKSATQKASHPPLRIRKTASVAPVPRPPTPPIQHSQPSTALRHDPIFITAPQKPNTIQAKLAHVSTDETLGSPMKEDATPTMLEYPPSLVPPSTQATPVPTIHVDPPMDTPPIETLPPPPPSGVRRTTRQRKVVSLVDIVPEPPTSRASTSRRKSSQGPRLVFTDAYSEMSATALKQLTSTNTAQNQNYLSARLEVEVVRKEGMRPESPMVKIKTIAQRQADAQTDKRSERAQRRARRSGEIPGSSDLEMDSEDEDQIHSSDAGDLPRWPPKQHTMGAGEDEVYETPDRAFKRMRLTESGVEQDARMDEGKKRVKWDRGLFTTAYLDEVVLGGRQIVGDKTLKGCLAPSAKALRLDTLGNLTEFEASLPELVPENVTVKKFVYDGETVEPVAEVVPKATRSKSKKAKS